MPFTFHGDIVFLNRLPHLFSHGEWDAYGISVTKYSAHYYPPFTLIFFAGFQFVFRVLFSGYESFVHAFGETGVKDLLDLDSIYLSLFLMKLPYLIFDGLLLWTSWQMLPDQENRRTFLVFWLVNPVVIYGTYMIGQFDLIPTYLVVLAVYLSLQQGKEHYASLSLAAGCLFKVFPLLFLPLVLVVASRGIRDGVRLALYGIVPVCLVYGLFFLLSGKAAFQLFSTFSGRLAVKTDAGFPWLRLFQASVYMFVCYCLFTLRRKPLNYNLLTNAFLAVSLAVAWGLLLSSTHYLIWMMPFMTLFAVMNPQWRKTYLLLLVVIFMAGLKARAESLGIFAPLNPQMFMSFPALQDIVGALLDPGLYARSVGIIFKTIATIITLSSLKSLYAHVRPT